MLPTPKEFLQILLTISLAVLGWIIFRATSMSQVFDYLHALVINPFFQASAMHGRNALVMCLLLLVVEWFQRDKQHVLQFPDFRLFRYGAVRWGIYYVLIALMAAFSGSSQEFIYFQF